MNKIEQILLLPLYETYAIRDTTLMLLFRVSVSLYLFVCTLFALRRVRDVVEEMYTNRKPCTCEAQSAHPKPKPKVIIMLKKVKMTAV